MDENSDDPEAIATNVPLTDVFGTHPKTKIIGALLTEAEDPVTHFSASEIGRIAGVDTDSVEDHVADLVAYGIVVETDELEDRATYKLDEDSEVVDDIRRLSDRLFERESG
ncbi:hypothetical protein [Natronococcus jeotgali]|uniref:HTH arsR-type domain-containing protein n=1 Tax=Natronococcus jeotgali DSM 18795 TaxID=1227498 RepID=L9XQK8_9EURY|nr:hypothetical protein [Natronococcus jeotgali]ELY64040.1 hypothetical protein C492_05952 [Natronococcus jeotgali DSM 18795]